MPDTRLRIQSPPAVILVGGLGTRLGALACDGPKPLVPVAGRPFLEHLVRWLVRGGVRRIVLAVGHRAERVEEHFGDGAAFGAEIVYSREDEPLGTGGALRQAAARTDAWPVLALNGDSFAAVDLGAMLSAHVLTQARLTVALTEVAECGRFGSVRPGPDGAILRFAEKSSEGPGLVSAGVYLLERDVVAMIPPGRSRLEHDVFPRLAGEGACGFVARGYFVDIGLPEDYRRLADHPEPFLAALAAV